MSLTLASKVQIRNSIVSATLDEDAIMANIETGYYFGLGGTAKRVWELLRDRKSVADICAQLQSEYNVDSGQCEHEVLSLINEMLNEGLVEVYD